MDDKRYVFTATSVHELHSLAKKLYLAFSQADKTLIDSSNSWTHDTDVDYSLNPHCYYSFRLGDNSVSIHKNRNGTYCLNCCGFTPSLSLYDTSSSVELYQHLYGKFLSFDEARNAFADVVTNLLTFKVRALF